MVRRATVDHHGRPVGQLVDVDRLEVLIHVEAHPVHHVARLDDKARAARVPDHGAALKLHDRMVAAVGAHHEHAGRRIHHADDREFADRTIDAGEHLLYGLARDQRDVDSPASSRRIFSPLPLVGRLRISKVASTERSTSTRARP